MKVDKKIQRNVNYAQKREVQMKKLLLVVLFLLTSSLAFSQYVVDYGPKFLSPTCEVATPHIPWLKPNSHGTLNLLFITHRAGMREIVELSQRMDIQYTVFGVADSNTFYTKDAANPATTTRESMVAEAEEKLNGQYDVIVLGNINWSCLPLSLRYQILKKVKEGTSLFGVVRGVDESLKRATGEKIGATPSFLLPYKGLPSFKEYPDFNSLLNSTIDVYQFGQGKILLLKGYSIPRSLQILTPPSADNPLEIKGVEYDYYLAYICHLLLFAANKEPAIEIKGKDYLQRNRTDTSSLEFILEGKEKKKVSCRMVLRNKGNEVLYSQTKDVALSPGENRVTFEIGRVPAGSYFADLWVTEGEKVLNFGSSFLEVSSDSTITKVDIKKYYRKEEGVSGTITLENKTEDWKEIVLKITQKDTFGRITNQVDLPLSDLQGTFKKEMPVSLLPTTPLSIIQYLEAVLYKEKEILDKKEKAFSIANLYLKDDIRYILWVGSSEEFSGGSYLSRHFCSEIYRAGFDTQYTFFSENIPLANIYHMPYAARFIDQKTDHCPHPDIPQRKEDDHVRMPCLTDPVNLKQVQTTLTSTAERLKPFSTRDFSMGDECHFASIGGNYELCFSPTCVAVFHTFLKDEYKTIENVNKEYGSNYTSFDQVYPVTLEEVKKDPKLIPLWVDYRKHMENTWAGIYRFSKDVIQKVIPDAKIGYEGSDREINSFGAADFYKLMQVMRLNGPYDGTFVPYAIADFSQPGTILGLGWYGGYNGNRSEVFQRYIAWRHIFRGANSFWVWYGGPGEQGSIIAPDLSFYDFFKANLQEINELKRGVGNLIISAKRDNDKVAILYSASSVHTSTLTKGFPPMEQVLNSIGTLLEDTRCQFQIISYKQLAEGILNKESFHLIILPFAQALSREEATEISAFVKKGGVVIADLRPAVCDQHGKPYVKGILDEVFGIEQQTQAPQVQKGTVSIKLPGGFPGILPATIADASLKITTGEPNAGIEKVPCVIVNKYGNGTALLLNFSLSGYTWMPSTPEGSGRVISASREDLTLRSFFKALLLYVGIKEKVTISPETPGLRTYRFKAGHLEYLGILQELPEPPVNYATGEAKPLTSSTTKITLSRKYHIYNVRKGEYLGYTDTIKTAIEPAKAELYSLLPYEVQKITITLPSRIPQGKALPYQVTLTGTEPLLGLHILHLSLVSPEGKEIAYYSENLTLEQGKIKGAIPIAQNETLGKLRLKVKDVASGLSAEETFIIE